MASEYEERLVARVKVIDRWPGRWRLLALFIVTALFTAVSVGIRDPLSRTHVLVVPGLGAMSYTIYVTQAVLSLVIFLAVMVWLSFSEQRVRRSVLEGLAFGSGIAVVMCAWERWQNGQSLGYVLLMAVTIVGTWVVVRLAVLWGIRSFVRRVVLQTGSLCRGCGYDLTGNTSGVCPECGLPVSQEYLDQVVQGIGPRRCGACGHVFGEAITPQCPDCGGRP